MAKYQLLLPKMGESVAEATIIKWLKKPGDRIEADDAVVEIATDKVDSEVPSPVSGTMVEWKCAEDEVAEIGKVIAIIETEGGETEEQTIEDKDTTPRPQAGFKEKVSFDHPVVVEAYQEAAAEPEYVRNFHVAEEEAELEKLEEAREQNHDWEVPPIVETEEKPEQFQFMPPAPREEPATQQEPVQQAFNSSARFYSPLIKSIAATEGISTEQLDRIPGTGAEGRLTKDDLLNYLQSGTIETASPAPQPAAKAEAPAVQTEQPMPEQKSVSVSGEDEIIEMDRMRKLIANHMVMSKQTSPHVTSFVETDVTNLVKWREKVKNTFEKREGEKITFTPIFIEAVVKAIVDFPMINVSVNGTQIIKKKNINISMATALPNGNLIVPVIKQADELSLVGITKAVNGLANRARKGQLLPDDVQDGTFTITNVGSFGNVMGTPIINQPQVAILAVGAIKKKPAVIETAEGDMIAIRHMMFLSLSYDHRVVDGALGGSFLSRVAKYLEDWDVNRAV